MKKLRELSTMAFMLCVISACTIMLPQTVHAAGTSTKEKAIFTVEKFSEKLKTPDGKVAAKYSYQLPKLKGGSDAIKKINSALKKDYKKSLKNRDQVFGYAKMDMNGTNYFPYYDTTACKATYNKNGYISFFFISDFFGGGPHGYINHYAMTFSLKTGKKLKLSDVVPGTNKSIKNRISQKCTRQLSKQGYFDGEGAVLLNNMKKAFRETAVSKYNFYLKNGKAVVFFNHYDLGMSYADGIAPNAVLKGNYE